MLDDVDIGCPINWSHPLNRGRVAWWLALGHAGFRGNTWRDLCGLSGRAPNNGALTNGPIWQGARGRPGGRGSLAFDGVNDYVAAPDAPGLNPALPFSLALWLKFTTAANTVLFEKNGNSGFSLQSQATSHPSGTISLWTGGVEKGLCTTPTFNDGAWHRVVFVAASGGGAAYAAGAAAATSAGQSGGFAAPSYGASTPVYLGSRAGVAPWPGALDDVAIWFRALTAAEVAADYDLSRRGYPGVLNRFAPTGWRAS